MLGEENALNERKIHAFLVQNSADVWEQVLQSLKPEAFLALNDSEIHRQVIIEDVECILHFALFTCIEESMRKFLHLGFSLTYFAIFTCGGAVKPRKSEYHLVLNKETQVLFIYLKASTSG